MVADEIRIAVSVVAVIFPRLDPTIRVEVLATKVVSLPTRYAPWTLSCSPSRATTSLISCSATAVRLQRYSRGTAPKLLCQRASPLAHGFAPLP